MRRGVAITLAVALSVVGGNVSSLHVHPFAASLHPSHSHGLAVHEHSSQLHHEIAHVDDPSDHEPEVEADDDDASLDAYAVVLGCTQASPTVTVVADSTNAFVLPMPGFLAPVVRIDDARAHAPPLQRQIRPRAPPANRPA